MKNVPKFTRVDALCTALDEEVVFHLSLHSKELFHSNFLGWFCERYPDVARSVLEDLVPSRDTSSHKIRREHHNLDLVIELPGLAPVVIENKVFSPPDNEQLERYSEDPTLELDEPSFILLSLGSPSWSDATYESRSGSVWKYVSYRELASLLREVTDSVRGFDGELFSRYVAFISHLQDLVDEVGTPETDEGIGVSEDLRARLREIRLHDAIGKLRARNAIAMIANSSSPLGAGQEVEFDANFTNGLPLVEAFVRLSNGDRVGWQYQGNQWRLAVITKTHFGKSADQREMRHSHVAREYASWFDFSQIPILLDKELPEVPKNELKGGFNGFNPDFVYRYRSLPDLTINEAKLLSDHFLEKAINLFSLS
jgi:hypothetical protein